MLTQRKKKLIIKEHGVHETDTGSSAIQVGLLTRQLEAAPEGQSFPPRFTADGW